MDHHSLEVYLTLCRLLHFGRASEACHMSPSSLTRLIQRLETETGHKLLFRDNRTARLTPQGEALRNYAIQALSNWQQLKTDMSVTGTALSGSLQLFASVTASQSILPNVLPRFRAAYPNIHIQLETGYAVNAMQSLRNGSDVAVAAISLEADEQFTKKRITSTPIVAVASREAMHDLGIESVATNINWQSVPLVLPSHGQVRTSIDRWFKEQGLNQNIYSEVEGNEAALSLVALGCGIAFVPELVLSASPLQSQLQPLQRGPDLDDFHVGFCVRSKALESSLVIQAFWDSI